MTFSDRTRYPPMPIIVGAPRSGTTLLRFMLDSHPDLAIPPETGFLVPCAQLTGEGTNVCERFFQTVTGYPSEAPACHDFQIPADMFRARLAEIEPFTVADGIRVFYQLYASRLGKSRWGDKPLSTACISRPSSLSCPKRISFTSSVTAAMSPSLCGHCGSHRVATLRRWRLNGGNASRPAADRGHSARITWKSDTNSSSRTAGRC